MTMTTKYASAALSALGIVNMRITLAWKRCSARNPVNIAG
jgi:hypothetical protein